MILIYSETVYFGPSLPENQNVKDKVTNDVGLDSS